MAAAEEPSLPEEAAFAGPVDVDEPPATVAIPAVETPPVEPDAAAPVATPAFASAPEPAPLAAPPPAAAPEPAPVPASVATLTPVPLPAQNTPVPADPRVQAAALMTSALNHFVQNNYPKAKKTAEKALALDPENKKARELMKILGALG
jgi:hypothetical protein